MFTAKPAAMDMNFPHDKPSHKPADAGKSVRSARAQRKALLNRAIARQALSESAQVFRAAGDRVTEAPDAVAASFLDERMAFFAGRTRSGPNPSRNPILFRTGCFRPDLVQQEIGKMQK